MPALTTGILAHVDAGKTTCIESMLHTAGAIRKAGRVDHQDSFLDYDEQERKRKITIYSKQAGLAWNDTPVTVIDTPGHADFSAEMERTLSILDLAVVLISALDGPQSHTRTIWKCLEAYNVPAILFVNKMDITAHSREELLASLHDAFGDGVIDLDDEDWIEQIAAQDDALLEEFARTETLCEESIVKAVEQRKVFPVIFGSALRHQQTDRLLDALVRFAPRKDWPDEFGARVFKVTNDNGTRLTHLRLTGGSLKPKDLIGDQKVDQIFIPNGKSLTLVSEAHAGDVIAVKGLENTESGDGLGFEQKRGQSMLSASLYYELILPAGVDALSMIGPLRAMMAEDPMLQIEFNETTQSISVRLMGEIQKEILRNRIYDRTGVGVEFGPGKIVYMETIADEVFGYGHFEPLRHYAEVHLLLEPGKRGSGIVCTSKVGRDIVSLNTQRQILNSLTSRPLHGVLTGSELTDVKITLIAAREHQKHTQGGDLRQAARRAVRQGLKKAESILLEPFFSFTIESSAEDLSRILYELDQRRASVKVEPEPDGSMRITGRGPVSTMMNFGADLQAISRGRASVSLENDGYDVCENEQEVIEQSPSPDFLDRIDPAGSVFCSNGAGHYVEWDEVEEHLHIPIVTDASSVSSVSINAGKVSQEELNRVFHAAGGSNRNAKKNSSASGKPKRTELSLEPTQVMSTSHLPTVLIVDGYNMIYSWPSLCEASRQSLHAAREELISLLVNYQGYKGYSLIVVFDGNRRSGNPGSQSKSGSASIIYTPHGMSADSWIEKKVADLKGKFQIITATSDSLIQNSVLSHGARRLSARELEQAVLSVNQDAFAALKH